MNISTKPLLRGHFHQGMFFIALGAFAVLLSKVSSNRALISVSIYALCTLTMFGISSLYHRITWTPERRSLWKKLDHAGIYLMIAGTFTPIAVLGLNYESSYKVLLTIWILAFIGIIQSIYFVNLPKIVSSLIYLFAGYQILPYISELLENIGTVNVWLIVLGGISYSVGAICYGLKWPVLWPKYFGYHEVFHIFVNFGAIIHFAVVNSIS